MLVRGRCGCGEYIYGWSHGSGVLSSACDLHEMSVVRGV